MNFGPLVKMLLGTTTFVLLGMMMFAFAFFVIAKVTPFSIKKEIEQDQNVALAILIGSVMLGISIIIAAGVHG